MIVINNENQIISWHIKNFAGTTASQASGDGASDDNAKLQTAEICCRAVWR